MSVYALNVILAEPLVPLSMLLNMLLLLTLRIALNDDLPIRTVYLRCGILDLLFVTFSIRCESARMPYVLGTHQMVFKLMGKI